MLKCPHFCNGCLVFPRESFECPADISGFQRESNDPQSDQAWVFRPLWPNCPWRRCALQRQTTCKKVKVIMTCLRLTKSLELVDCQNCAERRKGK